MLLSSWLLLAQEADPVKVQDSSHITTTLRCRTPDCPLREQSPIDCVPQKTDVLSARTGGEVRVPTAKANGKGKRLSNHV
jgi:hypothetical protein